MSFKNLADRRRRIPRQRHRDTNWAAYDASLRGRGTLEPDRVYHRAARPEFEGDVGSGYPIASRSCSMTLRSAGSDSMWCWWRRTLGYASRPLGSIVAAHRTIGTAIGIHESTLVAGEVVPVMQVRVDQLQLFGDKRQPGSLHAAKRGAARVSRVARRHEDREKGRVQIAGQESDPPVQFGRMLWRRVVADVRLGKTAGQTVQDGRALR